MATGRRATTVLSPWFSTTNPTMMPSCTLAMHEGRLRNAIVRQVDRRLNSWIRRYPDVHVETVAAGTGCRYGNSSHQHAGVQLAVVGQADADKISTLAVPNCHPIVDYPACSVLLVRD